MNHTSAPIAARPMTPAATPMPAVAPVERPPELPPPSPWSEGWALPPVLDAGSVVTAVRSVACQFSWNIGASTVILSRTTLVSLGWVSDAGVVSTVTVAGIERYEKLLLFWEEHWTVGKEPVLTTW